MTEPVTVWTVRFFTYFGTDILKLVQRFGPSTADLDHGLISVRFKEHCKLDKPTAVGDHCLNTGHSISLTNTKVLAREEDWFRRKVKEAVYMKQRQPSMILSPSEPHHSQPNNICA